MPTRAGLAARAVLAAAGLAASMGMQIWDADVCDSYDLVSSTCYITTSYVLNCSEPAWPQPPAANDSGNVSAVASQSGYAVLPDWGADPDPSARPVCDFQFNASVVIGPNASLTCTAPHECELWFTVPVNLTLLPETSITASTIVVNAYGVTLSSGSLVSADGLGLRWGGGAGANLGNGGSGFGHGGQMPCTGSDHTGMGATRSSAYDVPYTTCCDNGGPFISLNATSAPVASFAAPWLTWEQAYGSGGGSSEAGRGGGRIAIIANGTLVIDGAVVANGARPNASATQPGGAGAGGTILLSSPSIDCTPLGDSTDVDDVTAGAGGCATRLQAVGGAASASRWAAGGGGVIALFFSTISVPTSSMLVHGGAFEGAPPSSFTSCYPGSAGGIFMSQLVDASLGLAYSQLRVAGDAATQGYATTLLRVTNSWSNATSAPFGPPVWPLMVDGSAAAAASDQPAAGVALSPAGQSASMAVDNGVGLDALTITSNAAVVTDALELRRIYSALQAFEHIAAARGIPPASKAPLRRIYEIELRHRRNLREALVGLPDPVTGSVIGHSPNPLYLSIQQREQLVFSTVGVVISGGGFLRTLQDAEALFGPSAGNAQALRAYLQAAEPIAGSMTRAPLTINMTLSAAELELSQGHLLPGLTALLCTAGNITLGANMEFSFKGVVAARAQHSMLVEAELYALTSRHDAAQALVAAGGAPLWRRGASTSAPPSWLAWFGRHSNNTSTAAWSSSLPVPLVASEVALAAEQTVVVDVESNIQADVVQVASRYGSIVITGRLQSSIPTLALSSNCLDSVQYRETCRDVLWQIDRHAVPPASNYTVVLSAYFSTILVDLNGEVLANTAMVCATTVTIQNVVRVSASGCLTDEGPGAGSAGRDAGGGAGHGGWGGNSTDGGRGGPPFDSGGEPLYPGSGGGSAVSGGGQGGGYVQVLAMSNFMIDEASECSADGGNADQEAGGGGSGGTAVVRTSALTGQGTLSATGGNGAQKGGGGAGGRINLVAIDSSMQDDELAAGAAVVHAAAVDSRNVAAADVLPAMHSALSLLLRARTVTTEPVWAALHALRSPLSRLGTPASDDASAVDAAVAFAGAYASTALQSDAVGYLLVAVVRRLVGSPEIAQNFQGQILLEGGRGASGATSGSDGTIVAPPCPSGYGGLPICVACGFGYYRNASAGTGPTCSACSNAPERGIYIDQASGSPSCAYTCPPGHLYPSCLTPFEEVLAAFHGVAGFAATVAGTLLLLICVLLVICRQRMTMRNALRRSESTYQGMKGYRGKDDGGALLSGSGGGAYGASTPDAGKRFSIYSRSDARKALGMSAALRMLQPQPPATGFAGARAQAHLPAAAAALPTDRGTTDFLIANAALQESDLQRHVWRIYLGGGNSFGSSWRLPAQAPGPSRRYIKTKAYQRFAADLNDCLRWPRWGWEETAIFLLSLIFTPMATYLHKWRKRVRVVNLMQRVLGSDGAHIWLRSARNAGLGDALRVGVSGDHTLAWIDILHTRRRRRDSKLDEDEGGEPSPVAGPSGTLGPHFPMALLLAGDGTFESPMYLDPNDVLVRAVPSLPGFSRFIDNDWIEFIAEFNARARCISAGAVVQTLGPVLAFLKAVNADPDLLGGLELQLVRYWPCAQSYVGGHRRATSAVRAGAAAAISRSRRTKSEPGIDLPVGPRSSGGSSGGGGVGAGRMSQVGRSAIARAALEAVESLDQASSQKRQRSGSDVSDGSSSTSSNEGPAGRRVVPGRSAALSRSGSRASALHLADAAGVADGKPAGLFDRFRRGSIDKDDTSGGRGSGRDDDGETTEADDTAAEDSAGGAWWQSFSTLSEDIVGTDDVRIGLLITLRDKAAVASAISSPSMTGAGPAGAARHVAAPAAVATPSRHREPIAREPMVMAPYAGAAASHHQFAQTYHEAPTAFFQFALSDDGIAAVRQQPSPAPAAGVAKWSPRAAPATLHRSDPPHFSLAGSPGVAPARHAHQRQPAPASRSSLHQGAGGIGAAARASSSSAMELGPVIVPGHSVLLRAAPDDPAALDDVNCCMCSCGNVACGIASDILSRAILDVGSHDDVVGHRLDMRLPYPGLTVSLDLLKRPEEFLPLPAGASGKRPRTGRALGFGSAAGAQGYLHRGSKAGARGYGDLEAGGDNESTTGATDGRLDEHLTEFMSRVMRAAVRSRNARSQQLQKARGRRGSASRQLAHPGLVIGLSSGQLVSTDEAMALASDALHDRARAALDADSGDEGPGGDGSSHSDGSTDSNGSGHADDDGFAVDPWEARRRRHTATDAFAAPASAASLWTAGVTFSSLCCARGCRVGTSVRRGVYAFGRIMRRTAMPLASWQRWVFYAVTGVHIVLMLAELALTFVLSSELWCIEPPSEAGGGSQRQAADDSAASAALQAVGDEPATCTYVPIALYLAAPPAASFLPALLGLAAVAAQSARGLRIYAAWNGASMWSTTMALVLVLYHLKVLGQHMLIIPFGLLLAKLLSAQCIPTQLAEIETARVIRGWRGLFEVRNGPVERTYKALKDSQWQ